MHRLRDWRKRGKENKGTLNDGLDSGRSAKAEGHQTAADERCEEDQEQLGMHVLVAKASDEEAVVDIVALHRLNGHYRKTWTTSPASGKGSNWLQDFLPEQVPNARIMSYGYNSAVQFSKAWTDLMPDQNEILSKEVVFTRSSHDTTNMETGTRADKTAENVLTPIRDEGLVRSELEAIALHILSTDTLSPNKLAKAGKTVLHLAVMSRSVALARVLLGREVPIDARDFDGSTPLSLSLELGDDENAITNALLAAGADVNVPDKDLKTTLHHVAEDGDAAQLYLLSRNKKANFKLRDRDGEMPFQKIVRRPTMDAGVVRPFYTL